MYEYNLYYSRFSYITHFSFFFLKFPSWTPTKTMLRNAANAIRFSICVSIHICSIDKLTCCCEPLPALCLYSPSSPERSAFITVHLHTLPCWHHHSTMSWHHHSTMKARTRRVLFSTLRERAKDDPQITFVFCPNDRMHSCPMLLLSESLFVYFADGFQVMCVYANMYLHLRIGWFIAFCFLYFACVF